MIEVANVPVQDTEKKKKMGAEINFVKFGVGGEVLICKLSYLVHWEH